VSVHHAWDEARALDCIRAHQHLAGAMLPALHALLEEFGYVDERAIPLLADAMNVSKAEVVGVINFYSDFRQEPPGRHTLKFCRAEACQSMGCEPLLEQVKSTLGVDVGQTTSDGAVTLEAVYCLGNCALSPAAMIDDRLYGRLTERRLTELVGSLS
jgi:formate dehydrogenase subunit gamma